MNGKMSRREFLKLLGISGVTTLTANSLIGTSLARPPIVIEEDKYAIMILIDGLRADLFFEMLESGKLPNIKEHIVDRGATMECVSPLPSTTGPAHLPFLTGTLPGRNHVTGIRWVNRETCLCRDYCSSYEGIMINWDYNPEVPNIFEILGPYKTAAIYGIVNKRADIWELPKAKEAWWAKRADWEQFDKKGIDYACKLYDSPNPPRFTFVWLPGVDHLSHFNGPKSDPVKGELKVIDEHIAGLIHKLKEKEIYEKTLIGIVSDHGLRDNEKHVRFPNHLSGEGLNVKQDLSRKHKWNSMERYNVVIAVSGNAYAEIYLCHDEIEKLVSTHDWPWEPTKKMKPIFHTAYNWAQGVRYEELEEFPVGKNRKINVIELLLDASGMNLLIVCKELGKYIVYSSSGTGLIERNERDFVHIYRYSVTKGSDPLGYDSNLETSILMSDGKFHSSDEWLKASWSSRYIDAIVQFSQIFDSKNCGDIIALSKPGHDLMDEGHVGSHGGPEREEVLVPAVFAGPGIAHKRLKYMRTVDVFRAYLKFFGINSYHIPIDGRVPDIFG